MYTKRQVLEFSKHDTLQFITLGEDEIEIWVYVEEIETEVCTRLINYLESVLNSPATIEAFEDDNFIVYGFSSLNNLHTLQLEVNRMSSPSKIHLRDTTRKKHEMLEIVYREENFSKLVSSLLPLIDPVNELGLQRPEERPAEKSTESALPIHEPGQNCGSKERCLVKEQSMDEVDSADDDLYSTAPPPPLEPVKSSQPIDQEMCDMDKRCRDGDSEEDDIYSTAPSSLKEKVATPVLPHQTPETTANTTEEDFESFTSDQLRELSLREISQELEPSTPGVGDKLTELEKWDPMRDDYYGPGNKINQKRVDHSMPADNFVLEKENDPSKQIVKLIVHNLPPDTNRVTLKSFFAGKCTEKVEMESVKIDPNTWRAYVDVVGLQSCTNFKAGVNGARFCGHTLRVSTYKERADANIQKMEIAIQTREAERRRALQSSVRADAWDEKQRLNNQGTAPAVVLSTVDTTTRAAVYPLPATTTQPAPATTTQPAPPATAVEPIPEAMETSESEDRLEPKIVGEEPTGEITPVTTAPVSAITEPNVSKPNDYPAAAAVSKPTDSTLASRASSSLYKPAITLPPAKRVSVSKQSTAAAKPALSAPVPPLKLRSVGTTVSNGSATDNSIEPTVGVVQPPDNWISGALAGEVATTGPSLSLQLPVSEESICKQHVRLEPLLPSLPEWQELVLNGEERCRAAEVPAPMVTCPVIVTGVSEQHVYAVKREHHKTIRTYHDVMRLSKLPEVSRAIVGTVYGTTLNQLHLRCKVQSTEDHLSVFLIDVGQMVRLPSGAKLVEISSKLASKPPLADRYRIHDCSLKDGTLFKQLASILLLHKQIDMLVYGRKSADFLITNGYNVSAFSKICVSANCLQLERIPDCKVTHGTIQQFRVLKLTPELCLQPLPTASYTNAQGVAWDQELQRSALQPYHPEKSFCVIVRGGKRFRGRVLESFHGDFTVLLVDSGEIIRTESLWNLPSSLFHVPATVLTCCAAEPLETEEGKAVFGSITWDLTLAKQVFTPC